VWCDGVVDALAAQAVHMMDNARALPTCPQPQKQQQTAALAAWYQEIGTAAFPIKKSVPVVLTKGSTSV
jgi:hypothetical protein